MDDLTITTETHIQARWILKARDETMSLRSLVEKYKVAKARLFLKLRDSADKKIGKASIEIRTGRKWSVTMADEHTEISLHHQFIVGATNKGREGPGHGQQRKDREKDFPWYNRR
ncbi:hypothetical protein DPMN_092120 [Dreissena polymorpha]|uniref:Uncharacterized protein n=1 Tax=Dreissena polymorpha TaxID=45954 RepID=A0A9D4L2Z9_DREPO|nr:hypothetical protein DPMN_092120 [Dreissena polymorpha]